MSQMAARGTKRTCQSCSSRFYDLGRKPVVCPLCEAELKLTGEAVVEEPVEDKEALNVTPAPAPATTPAPAAASDGETSSDDDEADEIDELADIETDDVEVDADEDDNTFIEDDDDDPQAGVTAIIPDKAKTGEEES